MLLGGSLGEVVDEGVGSTGDTSMRVEWWREVDRNLRGIARRRGALDGSEAHWLREAERVQIWKPLGMVSMVDYLERTLGYAPRTAQHRLRVARALGELPVLTAALTDGELSFSAMRALVRVATPATETAWRDAARGKVLNEIEELVTGRAPGDLPGDPPDPELRPRVVRFELLPATFALLRQARLALDEAHGWRLDDDQLVAALCTAALETVHASSDATMGESTIDEVMSEASTAGEATTTIEPVCDDATRDESRRGRAGQVIGRARFQIALTVCPRCDQGHQDAAGVRVPVDAATVERARCDAQHIGSLDGGRPERAHQDIPPSVQRFVWRRDGGRCQTPGCRSAFGIEYHHIVRRTDGGSHDPSNLTLRCSSCHAAHHAGLLTITGTAPDRLVTLRLHDQATPPRVHVDATTRVHADATTRVHADATTRVHADVTPRVHADAPAPVVIARSAPIHDAAAPRPQHDARLNRPVGHQPRPEAQAGDRLFASIARAQARDALVGLGWKPAIARAAVDAACVHLDVGAPLEVVLREALRRCPRPKATRS